MKSSTLAVCLVVGVLAANCGGKEAPKPTPLASAVRPMPPPEQVVASTPVATPAAETEPLKHEFPEEEFTESATRSRDPFRSFAAEFVLEDRVTAVSQREVVLGDIGIDELKIGGIVNRAGQPKAMLIDPSGKGYVVRRGQFVGRADVVQVPGKAAPSLELNWRVDRIRDQDVVFVREDPTHPDLPTATRVIALRPEGNTESAMRP